MLITVRHVTRYAYTAPTRFQVHSLRLTPSSFEGQRVVSWVLKAPSIERSVRYRDGYGNIGHLLTAHESSSELVIEAVGVVETWDRAGIVRGLVETAPTRVYMRQTPATEPDDAIRALATELPPGAPLERAHALMQAVRDRVDYKIGVTGAHTTAAEALAAGEGVCQDHAQIFISAARVAGVPARYVSGYFLDGSDAPSEAAHAWAEAWIDDIGWVAFDAANSICPTDYYVRVACGLDATSAAPVRGTRSGSSSSKLDVVVTVERQLSSQSQRQAQS